MPNPLASSTSWDLVAKEYAAVTASFFENYARVALDHAGVRSGTRVVDIAAGPGTLSRLAARRGCRVMAVDFSPGMIEGTGRDTVEGWFQSPAPLSRLHLSR